MSAGSCGRKGEGMANRWRAVFRPAALSVGGVEYGPNAPVTLHLSMELADAGVNTGRDVEVRISGPDLERVRGLVDMAIAKRDSREGA